MSNVSVKVINGGHNVEVDFGYATRWLTAQEAYDLHEALSAVLPKLVQPFQPYEPPAAQPTTP